MKHGERGATFLGMVVIIAILGAALYMGIRLTPIYLEYMKVSRALSQVAKEYSATNANPLVIRSSLERRWDVEDIKSISWKEVEIRKTSYGYEVRAQYRAEAPFIANVSLVADFDKLAEISQ
jgi:Domain of unknown function (DUF4845)